MTTVIVSQIYPGSSVIATRLAQHTKSGRGSRIGALRPYSRRGLADQVLDLFTLPAEL
jgi:hypothetical protein